MPRSSVHVGMLAVAALLAGCAPPAPPPPKPTLQPVAADGWQTYQAVLAGTYKDPAAGYDGVYPTSKGRVAFRIEVRVPRYAADDTVGPSLAAPRPGQPPGKGSYVVVRIYAADRRLAVNPAHIVPRAPCGPPGTPASAVSVGVRADIDGMRARTPQAGSPFKLAYTPIYVRFDADPGQVAACSLDFTAALGDGRLSIPALRLVSGAAHGDAPAVDDAAPGTE